MEIVFYLKKDRLSMIKKTIPHLLRLCAFWQRILRSSNIVGIAVNFAKLTRSSTALERKRHSKKFAQTKWVQYISLLFFISTTFVATAEEIDLSLYEKSIYSQNGEDGVLTKIFQLINPSSEFYVEFGAYDGETGSNTCLFRKQKWDGLLLDRMFEIPELKLYKEFITAENINQLFQKYNVPINVDLISIDIDYNDFYVWKSLEEKYNAPVVVIEYNATHFPSEDKVVKYLPYFSGDGSNYFGASILALYNLGRAKGYSLVYADSAGVNLFFIRDDILKEKNIAFKNMNDVEKIYRPPTYGKGPNGGHRADPRNRSYLTSVSLMEKN
jgi:hypothetical protein